MFRAGGFGVAGGRRGRGRGAELVRRRGLDPFDQRSAVRRLVEEVVVEYDDRALSSSLPPLADPGRTVRAVLDDVAGIRPLQRHLDPEVEALWFQ